MGKLRVAINGYGVIGKRIADAVAIQDDMAISGVCEVSSDYRTRTAQGKGFRIFAPDREVEKRLASREIGVAGLLDDLLARVVRERSPWYYTRPPESFQKGF